MLGINAQDTLLALKKELGLDKPNLRVCFYGLRVCWLGILGVSYTYRSPVVEMVAERL